MMKLGGILAVFLATGVCAGTPSSADDPPLAGLPSAPGPHIEKIKALGDNEWLDLGSPAPDPKWGKACGRAWGSKALVLAPDLRGAFLFGDGPHAHIKKADGHAMDDLWFYDINAHRWICLYPGMNPKTFVQRIKDKELKVDDEGRLVDTDGQPIPVHTHVHAWGFTSYDVDRKKFAFWRPGAYRISTYFLAGLDDMKPGLDLLEAQGLGKNTQIRSPWYYDVRTGKFDIELASGSHGGIIGRIYPKFIYVPTKKQYLALSIAGDAVYDPDRRTWKMLAPKGLGGWDTAGCYDSKRDRVYHGTAAYDVAANTWQDLQATGNRPSTFGHNYTAMEYDTANDTVVAIQFAGKDQHKEGGVYAYDPKANTWSGPLPVPAEVRKFRFAGNTCYDGELNVFLIYVARDGSPDGTLWAYRYKRAPGKK